MQYSNNKIDPLVPTWLSFTLVACGLYLVLESVVQAAPSSNNSAATHGRQVELSDNLVIKNDDGRIVVDTIAEATDADGDALESWAYTWLVDGEGSQAVIPSSSTIPAYTPGAGDAGKKIRLSLQAQTEERSFPPATAISVIRMSNEISIPYSPSSIPDNWFSFDSLYGDKNVNDQSFRVDEVSQTTVAPFNVADYCYGYQRPSRPGFYYRGEFQHKISFNKPVKDIKLLVQALDGSEYLSISTNNGKTPTLTVFPGTSGWGVGNPTWPDGCGQPIVNGGAINSNAQGSLTFYANVGGEYFTELTISGVGNLAYWVSYDHILVR